MKQSEKYVPHFHGLVQINTTYFYHSLSDHWYNRSLTTHYNFKALEALKKTRRITSMGDDSDVVV